MDRFIGVCGALRNDSANEQKWHQMMQLRQPVNCEVFSMFVSKGEFADRWGSSVEEANMQDPSAGFYLSRWGTVPCVFYQNAGWEYIWQVD
jgi:hypothetical protein